MCPNANKITTKLYSLLSKRSVDAEPKSEEAKRRLTFFVNSLFMDIPKVVLLLGEEKWRLFKSETKRLLVVIGGRCICFLFFFLNSDSITSTASHRPKHCRRPPCRTCVPFPS